MSGLYVIMGICALILVIWWAIKIGRKLERSEQRNDYANDVDEYLEEIYKVDDMLANRDAYSRDDILSGKPLDDEGSKTTPPRDEKS